MSGGAVFEVSDQVLSLLLLPDAAEDHLGSRDVLLGVGQVNPKGLLIPRDPLLDVGLGVVEPRGLAGLPPKQPPQVWSHLVPPALLHRVALRTLLHKRGLPLLYVPHRPTLSASR